MRDLNAFVWFLIGLCILGIVINQIDIMELIKTYLNGIEITLNA